MRQRAFICLFGLVAFGVFNFSWGRDADCSVARDPRRCEAKQAAQEACSGLNGAARSACVSNAMPPPDCKHAPDAAECRSRLSASAACKTKNGNVSRKCLRHQN